MKTGKFSWRLLLFPPPRVLIALVCPAVLLALPVPFFSTLAVRTLALCLCAYTLLSLVLRLPRLWHHGKRALSVVPHGGREWRARAMLLLGLLWNLSYAAFRMFFGVLTHSLWFCAEAAYYVILCVIRVTLVTEHLKARRAFRRGAYLLLLLSLAASGVVVLSVSENRTHSYSALLLVGVTLFSLSRGALAIYHIRYFKRERRPALLVAKAISLSGSLLSLFALQGTLLARFSESTALRTLCNLLTGGVVALVPLGIAIAFLHRTRQQK